MNRVKGIFYLVGILFFILSPLRLLSQNVSSEKGIKIFNFSQFQPYLEQENDTLYVINFWATWCAPCVKEIPYFEQLGEKYKDEKLKVIMVSLDMRNQLESKLIPFIEKSKMKNEVILLDDPRFNDWIPLVDDKWTGAIPATLIYGKGFRAFYPREFTFAELDEIVRPLL